MTPAQIALLIEAENDVHNPRPKYPMGTLADLQAYAVAS